MQPVGLDELLERSDIISMHAPGTKDAHHLMKEPHFRKMKKTALFVNTGRGSTVDEAALIKALQEGWIAGAGLDVLETEPVGHNNPLLGMDNVVLTAHVASASSRFDIARKRRVGAELSLVLSRQVAARLRRPDGAGEVQAAALAALLDGARPGQLRRLMPFQYVSVEEAISAARPAHGRGRQHPEPTGEAAKGILRIKGIDWAAVRLVYDSEPLKAGRPAHRPVAFYDDEPPRPGWAEILLLAERLAPTPSLAGGPRARLVFGLAHEICGEDGLGWARRLQLVARRPAEERRLLRRDLAKYLGQQVRLQARHGRGLRRTGGRPSQHAGAA